MTVNNKDQEKVEPTPDEENVASFTTPTPEELEEMRQDILAATGDATPDIHFDMTGHFFRSLKTDKLTTALAKARMEYDTLKQSGNVDYTDSKKRPIKYAYSTKDDMINATKGALGKHGLVCSIFIVTEPIEKNSSKNAVIIRASMKHESDQEEGSILKAIVIRPEWADGAAFSKITAASSTYLLRLAYATITGLSTPEPEHDGMSQSQMDYAIDEETGRKYKKDDTKNENHSTISHEQAEVLYALAEGKGMDTQAFQKYVMKRSGKGVIKLTPQEMDAIKIFLAN